MKLKMQGSGTVDVAESAFGAEFNEALVHQVVTAFLAFENATGCLVLTDGTRRAMGE